ncbi:hypothetical protein [Allokutzneria albata]|uniref:Uncharacterized protein n=1 Tax=Allokutzneria albata TaxID=211114 RepID=A0A1G9VDN9_ALLAB|nr:hypothetical protein [Allokutzneria albata]SDM70332.1 hypothetical protein SAMN04489726_2981 [Allokutzneria albata]
MTAGERAVIIVAMFTTAVPSTLAGADLSGALAAVSSVLAGARS